MTRRTRGSATTSSVTPTSYSIRSYCSWPGWNHPKSWVLENDGSEGSWKAVDSREDNNDLNDKHVLGILRVRTYQNCLPESHY